MSKGRKYAARVAGTVVLIAAASLVHPFGRVKAYPSDPQPAAGLLTEQPAPDAVSRALESKCADCHSAQTRWPAYSYVAPVSWLVERDVAEGRKHLDFSAWRTYSQEQKLDLLNRLASEARTGDMPPGQYSFIHRSSVLTTDEQQQIYAWAKGARRKMREAAAK